MRELLILAIHVTSPRFFVTIASEKETCAGIATPVARRSTEIVAPTTLERPLIVGRMAFTRSGSFRSRIHDVAL